MSRLDEAKARIAAFDALGLEDFAREDVTATRELLDHAVDDLRWALAELERFQECRMCSPVFWINHPHVAYHKKEDK